MIQRATITSKKQLTIPSKVFKHLNLKIGQKVSLQAQNGQLIITPEENLVEELAGSLQLPNKWKGKSIDQIIEQSKHEYFSRKYNK